jgi:hypothetical protein
VIDTGDACLGEVVDLGLREARDELTALVDRIGGLAELWDRLMPLRERLGRPLAASDLFETAGDEVEAASIRAALRRATREEF